MHLVVARGQVGYGLLDLLVIAAGQPRKTVVLGLSPLRVDILVDGKPAMSVNNKYAAATSHPRPTLLLHGPPSRPAAAHAWVAPPTGTIPAL